MILLWGTSMWFTFLLAVLACVAVLYAPGYLFARALSIARFSSVAIAPMFSVFALTAVGIVLFEAGISCSGPVLLASAIALGAVSLLVGKAVARGSGRQLIAVGNAREACKIAALYVAVALVVTFVVFLLAIDGPESFSRNDDTTVHLAIVRGFLDTGTFSTLHAHSYLDQVTISNFYPSAWHVATAVAASLVGNGVTLAANAMIVALVAIVFPLGMCLLLHKLFEKDKRIVWAGSLFVVAFCGFPWGFVVFGQLLSNMLAFILIPLAFVALMGAIEVAGLSGKVRLACAVAVGLAAIALAQPNGAFTLGIWAVLYCVSRIFYLPGDDAPCLTRKRVAGAIVLMVVACAGWAALYLAPFLQNVVQYTWEATLSPVEAIVSGLLFMFTVRQGVQPFLSVAVLAGVIYTCRNRRFLWMTVAYAFALLAYVVDASTDGAVKQLLTGFWYTDLNRTGAMAALFAIPLAALGFVQLVDLARGWCAKAMKVQKDHPTCWRLPVGILVALMLACQFFPFHAKLIGNADVGAGLAKIHREVSTRYSWNKALTSEEDAFVKQAMELIPAGSLVINVPSDGSCWSYGVEGINTYFRRSSDTGRGSAEESEILRTQLCDIASSREVRRVVDEIGARYVLMLDVPEGEDRTTLKLRYKEENWRGIESIDEQTPGFELLLSEGDMRLYEIEG
ncbi:DUF6541 family protein [Eggerthella timonensis]|uniref:DUF6541 family protein n=1 Tax=Eggerthella timonensis TaxID=1871008 RepID=UPI003183E408